MLRTASPIAFLLVCAALQGCGGGGDNSAPPATTPSPAPAPAPPAPAPTPAPAPAPAPTPTPPPPAANIPPLAQPPIDISGETSTIGLDFWGTNSAVNGGHGETIDNVECGPANTTFHIHSHVSIALNGQLLAVPAHIGILGSTPTFGGCTYQIHTHDESGRLHIEGPVPVNFVLGSFFKIWGQTLTADNVAGITAQPIVIYITESDGTTTIYQGDPNAIELTPHRLITFQIGTALTEIPNFTWSPN